MPYYIVVEEWNGRVESVHDALEETYDSREEAVRKCQELAEAEEDTFPDYIGMDCLPAEKTYEDGKCTGVIITTKLGLDPFYYYARIIEVIPQLGEINEAINKRAKEKHAHQEN